MRSEGAIDAALAGYAIIVVSDIDAAIAFAPVADGPIEVRPIRTGIPR